MNKAAYSPLSYRAFFKRVAPTQAFLNSVLNKQQLHSEADETNMPPLVGHCPEDNRECWDHWRYCFWVRLCCVAFKRGNVQIKIS